MRKDRKGESDASQNLIRELRPEEFPLGLKESILRPKRLFYRGTLPPVDAIGIAMVGTRRPSRSAKELCRRLVNSLQGTKAVVVSGLAQGIDSYCHEAALDAGIKTVAVIAQGLEAYIPGERAELARRIVCEGGAVVTEYQGDFPSYKGTFPARNRIISGMSRTVVLVQSKEKGGAMITTDYCLQEGKLLLAVPGEFDNEAASGPNLLLDQGKAKPIFKPESLRLAAGLPLEKVEAPSLQQLAKFGCSLSPEAEELFHLFNGFRKTFSEIQEECNFKTGNILSILTELEIAGLVQTQDNLQFYFNGSD
ncbi:MAG: DNA-protecting protein DprA [Fibrobacter sp.]|nr:DNA-protecting protein DprA [Fibrobacter sp.]